MAINDVRELTKARRVGIGWMILTVGGAILVGLFAIAYMSAQLPEKMAFFDGSKENAETVFIFFSRYLFHPLIGGFLLSAILAAVMSTISSQLLVTSSSMTEDIYKAFIKRDASSKHLLIISRIAVLLVAIVAFLLSLTPKDSILNLVGNAWAGFAAAFGPLIILSLFWKNTTTQGALTGMILGALTVLGWVYIPHNFKELYEIIPGFAISFVATIVVTLFTKKENTDIDKEYIEMEDIIHSHKSK